jgi:hypothetical protein|tara:strand:- start:2982 stop:3494 length:513 start_codon:yes stop_codon:yes gene_type:complete
MPRLTPEDDIDRMSERIFNESGILVQDRDTFDLAFNDVISKDEDELTSEQVDFREDVFRLFVREHPGVRTDRLFKKAGGKDLKRDRRKTAKRIVQTDKEFIKKGARRVDFAGFDIKEEEINVKQLRRRKEFVIPATVKRKVIFARKTFVKVKGKSQVRFRDVKGRFASIR